MTTNSSPDIERRALALVERLIAHPGETKFRARLLKNEPPEVLAKIARMEGMVSASGAMPTEIPGIGDGVSQTPPERFGPFKLIEAIGAGGMGEVWRGERDDGLYAQTVAVKLIQPHLLQRAGAAFEDERRILARLEHPNIARLIDGGMTADGRPCLVMEYVDGVPIDEAAASLSLAKRIALFTQAAAAVQYAHSRLIAHGDLKPSNILVDSEGRVRLLDFGIARLLTDDAEAFQLSGAVTASFASPQRMAGGAPTISDDVFALGRMLTLIIGMDGDTELSAIAAKASADDDAARYAIVPELTADLARWQGKFPVTAITPTPTYRARKYVIRNWKGVLAASALGITSIAATSGYIRADRAREQAESRFDETRGMANYMLFDLYDRLIQIPGTLEARSRIAEQSQTNLDRLAAVPDSPDDVKFEAAKGLVRLAQVQGVSGYPNLGQTGLAIKNLARADAILLKMHEAQPLRDDVRLELAIVRIKLSVSNLYGDHDADKALAFARSAEALLVREGREPTEPIFRDALWEARVAHGDCLTWLDRPKEALVLLSAEWNAAKSRLDGKPPTLDAALLQSRNMRMLGEAAFYAKDMESAVGFLKQGLAILVNLQKTRPNEPRIIIRINGISQTLGESFVNLNRFQEGLDAMYIGQRAVISLSNMEPSDKESRRRVLSVNGDITSALVKLGKLAEAAMLIGQTHTDYLALLGQNPNDSALFRAYARSIRPRGEVEQGLGNAAAACIWFRKADATWAEFDRRWGLTASDKADEVAAVKKAIAGCRS